MSLYGRPTALELTEAVEGFLREEVVPGTEGRLQFQALVAANAVAIIARELRAGPAPEAAHLEGLRTLGLSSETGLADSIRAGDLDDRVPELLAVLRESVEAKLAVANPKYAPPH